MPRFEYGSSARVSSDGLVVPYSFAKQPQVASISKYIIGLARFLPITVLVRVLQVLYREGTRLSKKQVKVCKRVVLHNVTGPLAGIVQIIGYLEAAPGRLEAACDPSFMYGPPTAQKQAQHVKTKPRYIEYREWAQAAKGRLNDFNPAQR